MPNNTHGYISIARAACVDVDAYNRAGVAATAMDNGVFVTLSGINKDNSNNIQGYEWNVAAANDASYGVWVVATPEVGNTVEMQMMSDPRYFYNEAGQPMSIKYLNAQTDMIQVNAACFASNALPTTEGYATIGANGKLVAAASAPADGGVTYFSVVGFETVDIGTELMPVVVLQCEDN